MIEYQLVFTIVHKTNKKMKKQKDKETQGRKINTGQTVIIVSGMLTAVFAWFFGFRPFLVNGISMYPTFNASSVNKETRSFIVGDYLIIDAFSYRFLENPKRLDVVVAKSPIEPGKHLLKRIVGLPNEQIHLSGGTVTITTPDSKPFILNEPYINREKTALYKNQTVQLGDSQYFLLGDNRTNSLDSRVWGGLTRDRIIGRVILRLYPFSEVGVTPGSIDKNTFSVL